MGNGRNKRQSYDGVVAAAPITVPYARFSKESAHWWIGRALQQLGRAAGVTAKDIDGLSVSSFSLFPDTAVGLTQHYGLSPRWLDHIPMGGASGVAALRRAARAVQAGDAEMVACLAGDTNQVNSLSPDAHQLQSLFPGRSLSLWVRRAQWQFRNFDPRLYGPIWRAPGRFRQALRGAAGKCIVFPACLNEKNR